MVRVFASMKSCVFFKMGHVGSKSRSLGQIIEDPMFVTKGLGFKSLLLNAIPHNPESSVEQLQSHHGPLVLLSENTSTFNLVWSKIFVEV